MVEFMLSGKHATEKLQLLDCPYFYRSQTYYYIIKLSIVKGGFEI